MPLESDLEPGKSWQFDAAVTERFDEMLERSIPGHSEMRRVVTEVGMNFIERDGDSIVLDLGSSRGESLAPFVEAFGDSIEYLGIEVSEPMRFAAIERFRDHPTVNFMHYDLREPWSTPDTCLVLSILTLMFVPIEHRQRVVQQVYDDLLPGHAFILVEKVIGSDGRMAQLLTNTYHARKMKNGYSPEEVTRKALSLEGVLVPVTAAWNEDLIKSAGFRHVECIWRSLNFAGWVALK
jgi:tRNA (cmo5U34)-methyltransferase